MNASDGSEDDFLTSGALESFGRPTGPSDKLGSGTEDVDFNEEAVTFLGAVVPALLAEEGAGFAFFNDDEDREVEAECFSGSGVLLSAARVVFAGLGTDCNLETGERSVFATCKEGSFEDKAAAGVVVGVFEVEMAIGLELYDRLLLLLLLLALLDAAAGFDDGDFSLNRDCKFCCFGDWALSRR